MIIYLDMIREEKLVLNNKIITPNNIGTNFRNIGDLRYAFENFLEKELNMKQI